MNHPLHKLLFLFAFCFLQSAVCNAQNLVPNPSFELYDSCPNDFNQFDYVIGWAACTISSDYYNACDNPIDGFSVPLNCMGYQQALNGKAYAGIIPYGIGLNYREFIGCTLLNNLQIGTKYYLSFKVCPSKYDKTFINNIGMLFSNKSYFHVYPTWPGDSVFIKNFSHLRSSAIITDTLNWTTIDGSFIADSSYGYLIIGNFFDNNHTDTLMHGINSCVYYYIDDVCVSPDSLTCNPPAAISKINPINNNVNIYPIPASDKITLDIPQPYQRAGIIIYDLPGKKIITTPLKPDENQIDLSNLCPGVYFIRINFDGKAVIRKIVKMSPL